MTEKILTHVSLFAGMGGFSVGFDRLGIKTVLTNDIEDHCIKTMDCVHPESANVLASISDECLHEKLRELPDVDIVSGGFPCQPFSVAGSQDGFKDLERGSRFFDMMDAIAELRLPPKVIVLENVPNLLKFNDGQWMTQILGQLRKAGYWVSSKHCFVLNSREISGTPQSRERLFIVAYHKNYFRRNYFNLQEGGGELDRLDLWDIIDRSIKQDERVYLDPSNKHCLMIRKCSEKMGANRLFQIRRASVRANPVGICPTLTANMGLGGHNVPFVIDQFGVRRLTVAECLKLQGFNEKEFRFPDGLIDSKKLTMIGNSVNPDVVSFIARKIIEDIKSV